MSSASSSPLSSAPSDLEEPDNLFLNDVEVSGAGMKRKSPSVAPLTTQKLVANTSARPKAKPAAKKSGVKSTANIGEKRIEKSTESSVRPNLRRSRRQSSQRLELDPEVELDTTLPAVPEDSSSTGLSAPRAQTPEAQPLKISTTQPDAAEDTSALPQATPSQSVENTISEPDDKVVTKAGEQSGAKLDVEVNAKADDDLAVQLQAVRELSLDPTRASSVQPSTGARNLPKRVRKAPSRLEAEVTVETPRKPGARPARSTRGPNYDPEHVMTSKKSILTKPNVDLQKLLCDDRAWDFLSREQQLRLIRLLPDPPEIDPNDTAPIHNWPRERLQHNSAFRSAFLTGLRRFKENLEAGRWDPEWIRQAEEASKERAAGVFDEWKVAEREEFWGQKMNGTNA